MTAWPDKPFIRIIRGTEYDEPIDGSLAVREESGGGRYLLISGPRVSSSVDPVCTRTDAIDEWEEVVPVPAADLKRLRDEFRGAALPKRRLSALLQVTSHVTPPSELPLDQAVSKVEEALSGSRTLSDTSSEEYLALLLEAISDFQGLERGPESLEKRRGLARIVRLCVEWVAATRSPGSPDVGITALEVLAEVRARVESDPAVGGFPDKAALAGDAALSVNEARGTGEGRRGWPRDWPGYLHRRGLPEGSFRIPRHAGGPGQSPYNGR